MKSNLFRGIIALLLVTAPAFTSEGDTNTPSETQHTPTREELFKKPKPGEPVFPLEDLIAKPVKDNDRLFVDLLNMLATMGLIIGGILLVAWFLKRVVNTRIEQMNENSIIRVVERRTLSPKSLLYVIDVDDRRIILAESAHGVARVADYRMSDFHEVAEEAGVANISKKL